MSLNPYNTGERQIPGSTDSLGKMVARKLIEGGWVGLVAAAATAVVWWANTERDIAEAKRERVQLVETVARVEAHVDEHEDEHLDPEDLANASDAAKAQRDEIQADIRQIQQILMENVDG